MQTIKRVDKPPSTNALLQTSIIVFSRDFLPVARINIRRAIALLVTGQAVTLDMGNSKFYTVTSPSLTLRVSEHIRLTSGNASRHWKIPAVSRREVFRRDEHTCQYCGSHKRLTLDHVIPRSKGGSHTWDNVVTACAPCNHKKGAFLLHETRMQLKHKPRAPMHPAIAFAEQFWQTQASVQP